MSMGSRVQVAKLVFEKTKSSFSVVTEEGKKDIATNGKYSFSLDGRKISYASDCFSSPVKFDTIHQPRARVGKVL